MSNKFTKLNNTTNVYLLYSANIHKEWNSASLKEVVVWDTTTSEEDLKMLLKHAVTKGINDDCWDAHDYMTLDEIFQRSDYMSIIGDLDYLILEEKEAISMPNVKIEFVSYDYTDTILCFGTLVLSVNDEIYKFDGNQYNRFWRSGGETGFAGPIYTNPYIHKGPWEVSSSLLPEELRPYADVIEAIMNKHVPHGCCGGCL